MKCHQNPHDAVASTIEPMAIEFWCFMLFGRSSISPVATRGKETKNPHILKIKYLCWKRERKKAEIDTQKAEIEREAQFLSKQRQEIEAKTKELAISNLDTAKRLLGMGLNNEFIAIATMLSEDEIEKIRKEQ